MNAHGPRERAIKELIERECTAYLCRDYDGWADCVVQDDRLRRVGACMGGTMDYVEGWAVNSELMGAIFARYPQPNPAAAAEYRRTNWSIGGQGDCAWASFDQYGPRSEDPLVAMGLSHQMRVLERQGGDWKIAMFAYGDTSLEYFDFPVIRIDEGLNIRWMNDRAREELPRHPALMRAGGRLGCRTRADGAELSAAVAEQARLTVIDTRPSLADPRGRVLRPVLLTGETTAGTHVVWVSVRDRMLVVHFDDAAAVEGQLENAAGLFALSAAQTRLAALIVEGLDIPAAAARLKVSPNTAKTHLQRLFDKTGARSQPALVATLLGVTPPG